MARRYSDIKRAAKLEQARQAYIAYLQGAAARPSGIGTQGARDLSQILYVAPFTVTVEPDEVLPARCNPQHFVAIGANINASTIAEAADALGAKSVISLPKFAAARVVFFRNNTRQASVETSDVTGLKYLKYTGTRFSVPFGAGTAAADMMDAFLDVKSRILTANVAAATKRVSLIREKVGVESI